MNLASVSLSSFKKTVKDTFFQYYLQLTGWVFFPRKRIACDIWRVINSVYIHKYISDHVHIFNHLNITPTSSPLASKITFRHTKNITNVELNNDLASSDLILHITKSLSQLLDSYDFTLFSILDKHAPLITKH